MNSLINKTAYKNKGISVLSTYFNVPLCAFIVKCPNRKEQDIVRLSLIVITQKFATSERAPLDKTFIIMAL